MHGCAGDEALVCQDLREPLSPHGPAWPRTSKIRARNRLWEPGPEPLLLPEMPTVYLAHAARAVARDDLLTEESCKEKEDDAE